LDAQFKQGLCCRLVLEKFGSDAAHRIVRTMLDLSTTTTAASLTSCPVSVQRIYDALSLDEDTAVDRDLLMQLLGMLQSDAIKIVTKVNGHWGLPPPH
jgi:hypothetical protein